VRRAIAPLFALTVFAFVLFSAVVMAGLTELLGRRDQGLGPWQWWAFLALLGTNLALLVGGSLVERLRRRRRRR
jgi:hypothetical protein